MLEDELAKMSKMDYRLLEDPRMAKQALRMIIKTKQGLDDFVDTLELLSNPRFRKNLEQVLKEAREGKTVKLTVKDLRKKLK